MARTGVITVSTSGTSVRGPDQFVGGAVALRAAPGNTGVIHLGFSDDEVSGSLGFPIAANDDPLFVPANNLNELWFDASAAGQKVHWMMI